MTSDADTIREKQNSEGSVNIILNVSTVCCLKSTCGVSSCTSETFGGAFADSTEAPLSCASAHVSGSSF